MKQVKAWYESVIIPTYEVGEPEKNPIFIENRVYQGSSGKVYPNPIIEKISDEKIDKLWNAIFIENEFVKIMILPELGGRIQMAFDKTKQRHFVYHNHVIKPALVGLNGPWISGGIEFNWPQHHRPSTYSPVDHSIEHNADGSVTVWCSEIERMFRTKGMTGFTLYKDKAYLEIKVKLYNRTPFPQTFLWWANPAVKVNDHYQSVFPPDVNAVFDHGKRDVSDYPIATGTYYKVDYSPGTDISRYSNIPVPTSYMAINSDFDFVGGYENDSKGGLLHVADHNISPGKKQWTWGNGDFGKSWDRNLTDEDGPYIELMCGVYTDNQPDFSWLNPYEEKRFSQFFMPYRDVGLVKNATKEALINIEFLNQHTVKIISYTLGVFPKAKIVLKDSEEIIFEEEWDASPLNSFEKELTVSPKSKQSDFTLTLYDQFENKLVSYSSASIVLKEIPEAAKPAKLPEQISSVEQLFLTGLHLEQYRHATYDPRPYYLEGLKREPSDIRCNNAMGLLLMKSGQFKKAENYFNTAIETSTEKNPNPYDGEPYFNLGLSLYFQEKFDLAYNAFYKSAWNVAWQDAAYFHIAQISALKSNYSLAIEQVDNSLRRNWDNHKARVLKVSLLRKTNQIEKALSLCDESISIDKFNFGILFEKYLLTGEKQHLDELNQLAHKNIQSYIEFALDYAQAGCYNEAFKFLQKANKHCQPSPLSWYFLGDFAMKMDDIKTAKECFEKAESLSPDGCFAYRLELINTLNRAISLTNGAQAHYHLGNLFYDKKQYTEAIDYWEKSREIDPNFPTVHRNLALAYYNKAHHAKKAIDSLEKAFSLNKKDSRVLYELDSLYKRENVSIFKRHELLLKYPDLVNQRDDLYLEECYLQNLKGNFKQALSSINDRIFHPWEGGEGKVTGQYVYSLISLAKKCLKKSEMQEAIDYLKQAEIYPNNLGEGKLHGAQENDIHYWIGCAYEGLNDVSNAQLYWQKASVGLTEPSAAIYYNDQQPDKIFYQGLALLKLACTEQAQDIFSKLIDYGKNHINDDVKIDYFAVSLPDLLIWDDDLVKRNKIHCKYLIGLGNLGFGDISTSQKIFEEILTLDQTHMGARVHLEMCQNSSQ